MSFAGDNRETWGSVAAVVAAIVASYFDGGATAATTLASMSAEAAGETAAIAAANAAADTAAAAALSTTTTTAASYATYAAMAAQALGGIAAVTSAQNQQGSAIYNAEMGKANAQQAFMQAGAAEDVQRRRAGVVLGEQRAGFAQSGVDPSSGTGLLVQEQSAHNAELDALNIRYQGLLQGRGLLAQSELDTRQAKIYGQNAVLSGLNAGLSTYGAYNAGKGRYLQQRNLGGSYGGMYGAT